MTAGARPPLGITAEVFFDSWLPEAFAAWTGSAPSNAPSLRLGLSGAEGGEWDLAVSGRALSIARNQRAPGPRRPDDEDNAPDVWLRLSVADFFALFHDDPDLPRLVPESSDLFDLLFADESAGELVRALDGRLRVEIEGRRRRRFSLDVAFGPNGRRAGQPRAIVRVDGATLEKVLAGTLSPLEALLAPGLRLEGDRGLALKILMLAAARAPRR